MNLNRYGKEAVGVFGRASRPVPAPSGARTWTVSVDRAEEVRLVLPVKNGTKPLRILCDVLVVCEPDIVIYSVKDVALEDPDDQVHHERWPRRAVDASLKQLYGATKWLQTATHVIHADGTQGIPLPPAETRRIHRIAVAFGSGGECSISSGDFGKGHVHVFTEQTLVDVVTGRIFDRRLY